MTKKSFVMNNLLIVKNKDNKRGAFNKDLENVLPFEYDSIYSKIRDGREIFYSVKKDGVIGFVPAGNTGEFIEKSEDWIVDELAYYLIKKKNGKYGITDVRGNFVILPVYDKIEPIDFSESYNYYDMGQEDKMLSERFLIYKDNKVGLANCSRVLCTPMFDKIFAVTEVCRDRLKHVFRVEKDGLFGYIDAQGNVVCDIKYEEVNYPCTGVLTWAKYGNKIDIINIETRKVICSVEKDFTKYINLEYKHCCFLNETENCEYVLDSEGIIITKFEKPKEIEDYEICYINSKFLGYKKQIANRHKESFGILSYSGEILFRAKYSSVIPIKGSDKVVASSLFSKNCELLDENCNVIMDNFVSLYGVDFDYDFGIIPPLLYEKFNSDDFDTYFTDKNLNFDSKECNLKTEKNIINLFRMGDDDLWGKKYEVEVEEKTYTYYIPEYENKIFVLNEDGSTYKSIDFEVSSNEDVFEYFL